MRDLDLLTWFAEDELERCPLCAERSALPTPSGGFRVCLSCGLIRPDGRRVADLRATDETFPDAA